MVLVAFTVATQSSIGQTIIFSDDFSTSAGGSYDISGAIGSNTNWSLNRTGDDLGVRINGGILDFTNNAQGAGTNNNNGYIFGFRDINGASGWNTTLSSNSNLITWDFNIRCSRNDPSGYGSSNYGAAFVLASTSNVPASAGSGYAVVYGQSGGTDPMRLITFNNGLRGTLNNVITSNTTGLDDFGSDYLSVRVVYTASSNTWELFVRNDGSTAFANPNTGTLVSQGTATNNTYTGTSGMRYVGGYWQAQTADDQTAFFDNITMRVLPCASNTVTWLGYTSNDWNVASNWCNNTVPTSTTNVIIPAFTPNAPSITSANAVANSVTIQSGASLTMANARLLTITNNGSFNNSGTFNAGDGTVVFTTGTVTGTVTFNNVTTSGGLTFSNATTINGNMQLNTGGFISSNAPRYANTSTLTYNTGGNYGRGLEWSATGTGTIGTTAGYPNNVTLSGNTALNFPNGSASTARGMEGSLTINNGSALYMDFGSPGTTGSLTVKGNFTASGNYSLGDGNGGDLILGGNYTEAASGVSINYRGRAVIFNGTGTQVITKTGGGTVDYTGTGSAAYFVVNKAAGNVQIASNSAINLSQTSGDVLQILNTGGVDLNGRTLTLAGNGGNILVSGGARTITSSVAGGTLQVNGTKTVTAASAGTLSFAANVNVRLSNGFNFGAGLSTINGTLEIASGGFVTSNPATYAAASTLIYASGGTYGRGLEWSSTSGSGYPANVTVNNGSGIDLGNGGIGTARQMSGNLTINGSFFMDFGANDMTQSLTVLGNLTLASTGQLSLSQAVGGDLVLNGNWLNNGGTFNPQTRAVIFSGGGNQTITRTGGQTFDFVTINKSGGSVTLINDITCNQTLTLTSGDIITGANEVFISSTGNISGGSTGSHIVGNLERHVATGSNVVRAFPLGDGTNYSPVNATLGSVTTAGSIVMRVDAGAHPNIATYDLNTTKYVNRYWSATNVGSVFTGGNFEFNYVVGDLLAGALAANIRAARFTTGTGWSYPTTSGQANYTFTAQSISNTTLQNSYTGAECRNISAGTLSGTQAICSTGSTTFSSNGTPGGTWSSDNTGVATVNASSGLVSAVAAGIATITYSFPAVAGCSGASANRTVTVTAAPSAGTLSGTQTVCVGANVTFASNGSSGTWSSSNSGVASINSASGQITGVTTGSAIMTYTATGTGGCSNATATRTVTVNPRPTGVTASASPATICEGGSVALSSSATSNSQGSFTMLSENFNAVNAAWTTVNNSTGGTPGNAAWSFRANNYTNPDGTTFTPGSGFIIADSDAQGATSNTNVILTSPAFSTIGVPSANITLSHHYNYNTGSDDRAYVEASTNGVNWTTLQVYSSDQGAENSFASATIGMGSQFMNQAVVYIRFRYTASFDWWWAINNVTVTASSTTASFAWTSTPAGYTSSLEDPTGVTPNVNTTYTVTATNNYGCSTSATTASVIVTAAPDAPTSAGNSRCGAGTVALSASVTSGNTVDWYANATGGAVLAGGSGTTTFTTPNISVTTTYYAQARNSASGCPSVLRTPVVATINQTPAINSPFTGKGCDGVLFSSSPVNVDDGVVPAGTTYTWSAPTGSGFTGGSAQNTPQSSISQTLSLTGASAAVASYVVTPSVGNCTGASFTANITINPNPTVAITADYCSVGGTAVLSATAGLSSYSWSTGSTGATLNAQQAGSYTVTAFNAQGCSGTASIGVATELVSNGNFNAGNTGFTTGYTYVLDGPGNSELVPEGTYSIAANANNLHNAFNGTGYGGSGNFMIINGSPTITTIWSQNNIAVQPNTTYYFSAWGLTLVNGNNAALQFSINGTQVGSIAYLPNGTTSAPYPWERFYGQWNSGNNTSVDISIVNLQLAAGGNDFGLDNISFGTFAPIGLAVTPGANGNAAVCQGSQFFLNANADGGASPYTFAWTGPNGFTSTQENPTVTNNATSAINGTYNVTITDGLGCVRNGSTAVTVSSLPTALSPTAATGSVCAGIGTNINIPNSQEDVGYTLYNSTTNLPVSATLPGNGGTLSLSTGALENTTTFYVIAQRYATGCDIQLTPSVTVTVATTPELVTNNIALCTGTANLTAASVTAGSTGGGTLTYWTNAAATTAVANPAAVNAGTYYIKAVVGSCQDIEPVNVIISGTPVSTFNYTGSPFCSNGTNPAPVYSGGGSAGVYSASPAGLAFVSTSTGVIDLAASSAGTYTVTNTITPVGACTPSSTSRTITVTAAPDPSFSYASNGFCQAVGANNPVPIFQGNAQAGTFSTSVLSGLSFVSTATGEVNLGSSTPGSYAIINTVAATAGCASVADTVFVDINPYTFTGAINVSSSDDQLCLGETVDFFANGTSYSTVLERETFNGSFTPWTTTNSSGGGGTPASAAWTLRVSPYNYNGNNHSSNDGSQFYMSNSQAQGGGNTNTTLKSPVLNTIGFTSLTLSFFHYFNDDDGVGDDVANVQVSTNNTTWNTLRTFDDDDEGGRNNFVNATVDLTAYVGLPSVWVRFQYIATNDRAWAIDNVTISGNSNRYTYNWSSVPIAFTSNEQNPAGYQPSVSAYYDVEALNVYGCTSNTSPIPVIVNPLPEDNAGTDLDICSNTSGVIGLASQGGRTYSWSPATGLSDAAIAQPTAAPAASATYTLTETITATGCSDTNNVFVNIRPISVINNMTAQLCSGSAFTASPANGTNGTVLSGTTYVWDAPTGAGFSGGSAQTTAQSSVSQTLSATSGAAATATYAVTPKVNGCDGAPFNVSVTVSPQSDAGTISGATSVCVDVNSTNLSVSGNVGNLQWQSSTNNVSFTDISGETGTGYTATNLSSTTFYRVVSTSGVCPADNGNSAQISMLSRPTATLSGSANICAGNSSSLSLELTGTGPWSGTLSNGQSFSASSSPAVVSVTPGATATYSLSTLNDANCSAISGLNGSATVNVNALPTASISGSTVVCGGSSASVTINGPANGQVEYTLNGTEQSINLNGSGTAILNTGNVWQNLTYSLIGVEDALCENTATGTASITYQEAPDATISGSTQLCSGQSTTIAFSGNPNATVTYNVNNGASQSVTLNASGNGSINTGALSNTTVYNLLSVAIGSCSSTIGTSATVNIGLTIFYQDLDNDGYGNAGVSTVACNQPVGYVAVAGDCCDTNADINPICEWWGDMDGDGWGSFIYDVGCITGVGCSEASWPAQLIPYCPQAHAGATYTIDCNDNSMAINPDATEICNNTVDDDCDGQIGEGCSGQVFDQWSTAQLVNVNTTNAYYPNCQTVGGTLVNTDISPQGNPANVAAGGGRDVWYRFVAPTTGVRIRVNATGFNAVIELQTSTGTQIDAENVNPAVGGAEILNYGNLVAGQTYYVGVRNYDATNVGTYTLCISPLRASGCATATPAGGASLCNSFKVIYTSATSYTIGFTGIGGTASGVNSSVTSLTGLITLSNPSLALRYGGVYNVQINANYVLTNGLGQTDNTITVLGNSIPANCQNVTMMQQPLIEVRNTQICPTVLSRATSLFCNPVTGSTNVCGVVNYTFEFTRVSDCLGTSVIGSPFNVNSTGSSGSIALTAVFPVQLSSTGYWSVRVRPNFSNGYAGTWGPAKVIAVSGSAAGQMLDETQGAQQTKTFESQPLSVVYPNPNNGNEININLTDIGTGDLTVKVVDALGRTIYTSRYSVNGSLFTKINFGEQLTGGIYLVEFTINGETMNERMIVER